MAAAGLLAHIVVSKFEDALPFHRQSKQFARMGIDLPRATLCNRARQMAEKASPLADLMDRAIREGKRAVPRSFPYRNYTSCVSSRHSLSWWNFKQWLE